MVFDWIDVETDLVEPIFCLEEERGSLSVVFWRRRGEDGGWT